MNSIIPFIILIVVLIIGGVVSFFFAFKIMLYYRLINDTPTSKIRSMAMGFVEVKGKVKTKEILKSPFSGSRCAYFKYIIKEYKRHVSHTKNGTRTHYSWDTVGQGERMINFFIKDNTGEVMIDSTGAKFYISLNKIFYQKSKFGLSGILSMISGGKLVDPKKFDLQEIEKDKNFGARVGDRKYYEYMLVEDDESYILGTAINKEGKVSIKKGENEPTFIISDKPEEELVKGLKWKIVGLFLLSIILIVGGIISLVNFL